MMEQYAEVGSITVSAAQDTASEATVTLGFKPSYVKAYNYTDVVVHEYFVGMDNGTAVSHATAGDTTNNAAGGITLTSNGFTLGADIIIDEDDVVYWLAIR